MLRVASVLLAALLLGFAGGAEAQFPVVGDWNRSQHNSTDTTSHVTSLPSNIVSGDLLLLAFCADEAPTITWPSGWTEIAVVTDGSSAVTAGMAYRVADGSEGATATVTTSTTEKSAHLTWRIKKDTFTGTPEGTTNSGTSANPDPPALTPSWGTQDVRWIVLACVDGTSALQRGSTNYFEINRDTNNTSTGVSATSQERPLNASTENPGGLTNSSSSAWSTITVGVRGATPAGGGGGTRKCVIGAWLPVEPVAFAGCQRL